MDTKFDRIAKLLSRQSLKTSEIIQEVGVTLADIQAAKKAGLIIEVGMVSNFRPLTPGEVDEPMFILDEAND